MSHFGGSLLFTSLPYLTKIESASIERRLAKLTRDDNFKYFVCAYR